MHGLNQGRTRQGGVCRDCRIVFGGVAAIPWRSNDAEAIVEGQRLTPQVIETTAEAATTGAVPQSYDGYKVALVSRPARQTLT